MDLAHDHTADGPRPPRISDLVSLCRWLNEEGAHYIVVGGFAILQAGLTRSTADIDFLVEASPKNEERVLRALMHLPDAAAREIVAGES